MSVKDEWENSIRKEIEGYDEYLDFSKEVSETVPDVQERKREAEAKLKFVQTAPEDYIEELSPGLLQFQKEDEERIRPSIMGLTNLHRTVALRIHSSTGDSSAYSSMVSEIITFNPDYAPQMEPALLLFNQLAEEKGNKPKILTCLRKLPGNLGDMFSEAQKSYNNAKAGIMNVNKAMGDMRSVLNAIFGNLAEYSRKKFPTRWMAIQSNKFRNLDARALVADCLSKDPITKLKLAKVLDGMYQMYCELSDTTMSKNPLNVDTEKMERYYDRWVLHISDLVDLIDWVK